jgi:hypothetical protein
VSYISSSTEADSGFGKLLKGTALQIHSPQYDHWSLLLFLKNKKTRLRKARWCVSSILKNKICVERFLKLLKQFNFFKCNSSNRSQDSIVCIVKGYRLDDWGVRVRVPVGASIFSSPYRPDRLWGPSSFLCKSYRELFPWG